MNNLKITQIISERTGIHKESVAENKQDLCVSEIYNFTRGKTYVDLASNDAKKISNTYYLDNTLGWKGLCIEPQTKYISGYLHERTCVLANLLVNNNEKHVKFAERVNGGFSGIVGYDNKNEKKNVNVIELNGYSLHHIMNISRLPATIDYFSLDIEGYEYSVMKTFPFHSYIINLMTVERPGKMLHNLLLGRNMCVMHNGAPFTDVMYKNKSAQWPLTKPKHCKKYRLPSYIYASDLCSN